MNRFKSILANTGYFTIGIGVIAGELAISGYDRVAKACDHCVDKGKSYKARNRQADESLRNSHETRKRQAEVLHSVVERI